jgi:hypothetical protein
MGASRDFYSEGMAAGELGLRMECGGLGVSREGSEVSQNPRPLATNARRTGHPQRGAFERVSGKAQTTGDLLRAAW